MKLVAFSGSTRSGSFNQQLIKAAAKIAQEELGLDVTVISLSDYPLPLYDGDWEDANGLPEQVLVLKQLIHSHDAVLIASPEYNASVTAVLKNTIDWMSRPGDERDPGKVLFEKPVALLSASPGGLGGIRGLNHLRAILQNLTAFVTPSQFALAHSNKAFTDEGTFKSEDAKKAVIGVLNCLQRTTQMVQSAH